MRYLYLFFVLYITRTDWQPSYVNHVHHLLFIIHNINEFLGGATSGPFSRSQWKKNHTLCGYRYAYQCTFVHSLYYAINDCDTWAGCTHRHSWQQQNKMKFNEKFCIRRCMQMREINRNSRGCWNRIFCMHLVYISDICIIKFVYDQFFRT